MPGLLGRRLPPATPEGFSAAVRAIIAMPPGRVPVPSAADDATPAERVLADLARARRRNGSPPAELVDRLVDLVAAHHYWERIRSGEGWADEPDPWDRLHRVARAEVRGMLSSWS